METLYAICWNNEKTGKAVIVSIYRNEKKAKNRLSYYNKQNNVHYLIYCNDINLEEIKAMQELEKYI